MEGEQLLKTVSVTRTGYRIDLAAA